MRKNLVIVRAGDQSLHPSWLEGPEERNWDLLVSYYGDDPHLFRKEDVLRIDAKGLKWPALYDLIRDRADDLINYEYIWLPDDDLACDKAGINRLFVLCHKYDLELAQPSLSINSYATHLITLRNRSFILRYTNFVEIMAPCFSSSFLNRCHSSFSETFSGHGLDYLWPTWVSDITKIAIIDNVIIRHTRPIGGPSYGLLAQHGVTAYDERLALLLKYEIRTLDKIVTGGIDLDGRKLTISDHSHSKLISLLLCGYLPELAYKADLLLHLVNHSLNLLPPAIWAPSSKSIDIIDRVA
jgi:hypothetical protein